MLPEAHGLSALTPAERADLLVWLGDTPFTALTAGQVARGLCRAYVVGDPAAPEMAVVHPAAEPSEPIAFGTDTSALWTLLSRIPGWDCVNVPSGMAGEVASLLEKRIGAPTRAVSERYYLLDHQPSASPTAAARRLGPGDLDLVRDSDPLFRPFFVGHGDVLGTLTEGVVAGILRGDRLASAVTTSAWCGTHVDLGAATLPELRSRGLATAAARVVCRDLRTAGRKPVWAAGEANRASWSIPEKLGFRLVGRREYVVVESLRPRGFRPSG
jgi:GNAT superfamily N-acetyltransferase